MYNSAGFGEGFIGLQSPSYPNVASLISLLGETDPTGIAGITGTLESSANGPMADMDYMVSSYFGDVLGYTVTAVSSPTYYGLGTAYPSVGNWLVVVPEPSACTLMFAGGALTLLLPRGKAGLGGARARASR